MAWNQQFIVSHDSVSQRFGQGSAGWVFCSISRLHYLQAVWSWVSYLPSLCFSVLTYKKLTNNNHFLGLWSENAMAPHSSTFAWKIPWKEGGTWRAAVHGVAKSWTQLSNFTYTFHFHSLEKEMATHSSVLAWRIPGTGEPGGLLSMGLHRAGHDKRLSSSSSRTVTCLKIQVR